MHRKIQMNRFHANALTLINSEPTLFFKMIIPVTLSPEAPIQLRFENKVVSHQSATLQKKISSQVLLVHFVEPLKEIVP